MPHAKLATERRVRDALTMTLRLDVLENVQTTLQAGHSASTRIGTFYLVTHPGYEGRNPRTGDTVRVPPRRTVAFVPSEALTRLVVGDVTDRTEAEAHAETARESADGGATLAPSLEVPCTEGELRDCARALSFESGSPGRADIAPLGILRVRIDVEGESARVHYDPSDGLLSALNPE